ncbi:DUF1885 family protein [Ammoniphilus sp. CFH 90114]|uniref:DUF1885 family protein n=1 Tax=Ammoniphilus sp. CFH 90114 TaxID=2493665 RepID=UPI00100EBFF5|nr:DUF1885 family protein [Ammoniphilus sp. CFH 90114]RXT14970.1 DUF1885 family protein [Ammoniphilus sp. CFH 90114]
MGSSAYIKLVKDSRVQQVSLDDVKSKITYYINMTKKTGEQLAWGYADAAFPYTLIEKPEAKGKWFYLKGNDPKLYKYIMFGVGAQELETEEGTTSQHFIQVVLPEGSTHGDKGKANEFCKYLAKEFQGELHLFNKRVMYYYPRK